MPSLELILIKLKYDLLAIKRKYQIKQCNINHTIVLSVGDEELGEIVIKFDPNFPDRVNITYSEHIVAIRPISPFSVNLILKPRL